MTNDFVHLHVHSEYSMLDGLGRVKKLVAEAKRLGQPAIALTDHGVMHGAIEFFRACKNADIKPIVGLEGYQTIWGRPMGGRDAQLDRENYHLLLLAKNMTGYRNLLRIASRSSLDGYYYKPRVDHEFLAQHAEGIICSTGCLGGEVPQLIMQGKETEAYERLGWYVDVFGKENFFIELQEHSVPELVDVNKVLAPWAQKFDLQLIVTNDVHYVREEDGTPHDVLLCVQTGARVHEEKRMRLSDMSYFLKSRAQMEETFRPLLDLPAAAFDHTLTIAEMCEIDLEDPTYHLPDLAIPEGFTYTTYLRHLTEEGLQRLYGDRSNHTEVQERKERELRIIHEMGFDVYFLIVADLCNFARSRNIWWNVRGSGAGSLVAYCTGITGLDPLKNNLIFERFLNPGRVNMPDFDLDYPDDQREEMIRYTVEKYGDDQVAQIVTFGRMKARAAIRDVGRAKDVSLAEVDRIAKMIPAIPGKPVTINDVLTEGHEFYNPDLVDLYKGSEWARDLVDTSMQLEGVARHSGIHAAAVIVADRELEHYTPLMRGSKSSVTSTIAQYEFPVLESIGLLKVDFLGLSTLSVMREAGRLIHERHGIKYDLSNIPFEGEEAVEAFKLLSSGEVSGVFQVESAGMRRVLTEMKPSMFEHIVATISLYRPGPLEYIPNFIRRMHGDEEVEYLHPDLESILSETYGICVSGDSIVFDARTGRRYRLDELDDVTDLQIQGVDTQWRPAIGRVTHWIDSGLKPVFRVRLCNGAQIKVTADHRLLSDDGWRPLHELSPGDLVATPIKLSGPGLEEARSIDRRKLRVLAYLIADGGLASMASVDFVSKDQAMIDEYRRCLAAFPDIRTVLTPQIRGVTRVGVANNHETDEKYHAPNSLLAWMRALGLKHDPGGLRSHEKFLPAFTFELSEDEIAFFVASLWECDGHMGRKICHYRTVSRRLAVDVQTLLLRMGIRSVIHESEYRRGGNDSDRAETQTSYQVTVYETRRLAQKLQPHMVTHERAAYCTGCSTWTIPRLPFLTEVQRSKKLSARGLMAQYGIDRQHFSPKRRKLPRISAAIAEQLPEQLDLPRTQQHHHVDWQEILAIEPAGDEHVYDLTVEGLHSFVANNIIVHNCVYQEQIIQILNKLAGYTPGDADLVRRAIGKKKASEIERHKQIFIEGCHNNGIPKQAAAAIYADIEFFARYGFNKCLPGDVEVLDAETGRPVRLADLYTGVAAIQKTVTCDTTSLKLHTGAVTTVMDNGIKPVYRLTTALGRTIEATANHPFYTFDGWRLLEELTPGCQVAVPRSVPVEGKREWPEHEVIALGHLLAEGNLCHPHSVYYSQDPEQVDDFVRAAEAFDNVSCTIADQRGTASVYAKRTDRSLPPDIVSWCRELGIWCESATTKEIPGAAFELTNRQLGLLIARMWEGDGHIDVDGRSLFYATSSNRMAHQLQHLLLRFGIISRLRTVEFRYKEGCTGYQLFVTGNENLARFASAIGHHFISGTRRQHLAELVLDEPAGLGTKDVIPLGVKGLMRAAKVKRDVTWTRLNAECGVAQRDFYPQSASTKPGFSRTTIGRVADYFDDDALRRCAESDIYWDKILSIEYIGEKRTYDLEVHGTHNFVANDILVHNSHAADYAVITVQTAYLKAHYPVDYMAALLLIERDKTDKVINFINECRRMGIEVLPPDVNYSGLDFEIQEVPDDAERMAHRDPNIAYDFPVPPDSAIRFGMAAVKNVGEGPVRAILDARQEGGPFAGLEDFCDRVDLRQVNKRALECLIKVGALDRFGHRSQLLAVLDQMVGHSSDLHNARDSGQLSMFDLLGNAADATGMPINLPKIDEVKGKERLQWEKELLGVYSASHPLMQLNIDVRNIVTCACNELDDSYSGQNVLLVAMIADVRTITTKKGDLMAFVNLEDMQGQCEMVVFPRTFEEHRDKLVKDNVVMVKGKAETRNGQTNLLADSIQTYVEQAVALHAEGGPAHQTQFIADVGPKVNGHSVRTAEQGAKRYPDDDLEAFDSEDELDDTPVEKSVVTPTSAQPAGTQRVRKPAAIDAFDPLMIVDEIDWSASEENPFAADAPSWMNATVATSKGNGPPAADAVVPAQDRASSASGAQAGPDQEVSTSHEEARQDKKPKPQPSPAATRPDDCAERSRASVAEGEAGQAKAEPSPAGARMRNGRINGNGHGESVEQRELHITFRRSGELERDMFRLRELYEHIRDPRGRDSFVIEFESRGKSVRLTFPEDLCTISERLTGELTKHFRVDVAIEEKV